MFNRIYRRSFKGRSLCGVASLQSLESRLLLSSVGLLDAPVDGGSASSADSQSAGLQSGCCCPGCMALAQIAQSDTSLVAADEIPAPGPYALADTFKLNSLPGATKTIYLDFNGHTTSGTSWNNSYNGGANIVTPAYSFEGDASFSSNELYRIQRIWQRVAEDYAPFNINVTTQDPGVEALRKTSSSDTTWGVRVVIGGSSSDWYSGSAGGVAYISSFSSSSDTPAFVFSGNLSNSEKYVAEAITHEAGHTLGLSHDGAGSTAYYTGHGSGATGWAPIMGVGYSKEVVQWSNGNYPNANQLQDDLAIITSSYNGVSYRADDHGNTNSSATALSVSGSSLSGDGLIERNTDVDVFWFDSAGAIFSFDVNPFERGANLDILAAIYNSAGQLIVSANPLTTLSASLSTFLAAGRYYLKIDGVGKAADGSDYGYSDYGSLGWYTITGSMTGLSTTPVVTIGRTPSSVSEDSGSDLVYTFTRTGDLSSALTVNFAVAGTALFGSDYSQSGAASFAGSVGSITFAAGSSTATLRLRPIADTLVELDKTIALSLLTGTGYALGSTTIATGTIVDDDAASLSVSDVSIVEGDSGSKTLTFTVSLSRPVGGSVSVNYATANGSATAGSDYVAKSGTLSFAAGETSKTVSITISGDTTVELDESFSLILSGLAAGGQDVTLSRTIAAGTVLNDDSVPPAPTGVAATNNRSDLIRVTWSPVSGASSYEVWRTAGNNLIASSAASGLTTTEFIDVTAVAGIQYLYWVRAVNSAGSSSDSNAAAGQLLPLVTLTQSSSTVAEDSGRELTFTFTRTGSTASALTINLSISGTGIVGSDYLLSGVTSYSGTEGMMTFAVGSGTAILRIKPIADAIVEMNKFVTISIGNGTAYMVGSSSNGVATIVDDDVAVVRASDISVNEGNGGTRTAVFTVTLSRPVTSVVTIGYATFNGTASAGSDFVGQSRILTFQAGEISKMIVVTINGDTIAEGDEVFELILSNLLANGHPVSIGRANAKCILIDPWEAESSGVGHLIGRPEGDGWSANTVNDNASYLLFGPYTRAIPPGLQTATFRLLVDNHTFDNSRVARIEVFDASAGRLLGQRVVTRHEFRNAFQYQNFDLNFVNTPGALLEFRIWWYDTSYVKVDHVRVTTETAPLLVLEAERDLRHLIGRAANDGWTADTRYDSASYLAYGPYTTMVPAGRQSAAFRLLVDNNSFDNSTVVTLDVFDAASGRLLAQKVIRRKDFAFANHYQDFSLDFDNAAGSLLEFRTFWHKTSFVKLDRVVVSTLPQDYNAPLATLPVLQTRYHVAAMTSDLLSSRGGTDRSAENAPDWPHDQPIRLDNILQHARQIFAGSAPNEQFASTRPTPFKDWERFGGPVAAVDSDSELAGLSSVFVNDDLFSLL